MLKKYLSTFNDILQKIVITDIENKILNEDSALGLLFERFDTLKKNSNIIYLIGNGGSSGIVSHISVDFVNTCKINAFPLTDNSQLTCFANDFGYEYVFSKPLETIIRTDDILIAVSSSGSSKNIINAVKVALNKKAFVITLSGFSHDNPLRNLGNINIWLNSNHYGMVEIGHSLILHYITDRYSNTINL